MHGRDWCSNLIGASGSPLQIAILNLFMELQIRFANMVMGMITRDSIRKALANGISAEQVRVNLVCTSDRRSQPLIDNDRMHADHQFPHHTRTPGNEETSMSKCSWLINSANAFPNTTSIFARIPSSLQQWSTKFVSGNSNVTACGCIQESLSKNS